MPIYRDTIMIHGGRQQRAVQVIVEAPEGTSVVNLQELAQRAWIAPGKVITTVDKVTVKVTGF